MDWLSIIELEYLLVTAAIGGGYWLGRLHGRTASQQHQIDELRREQRALEAEFRKHEDDGQEVRDRLSSIEGIVTQLQTDIRRLINYAWPESRSGA